MNWRDQGYLACKRPDAENMWTEYSKAWMSLDSPNAEIADESFADFWDGWIDAQKDTKWSSEWPLIGGDYWFLGWTSANHYNEAPVAYFTKVRQISNGIMYTGDGVAIYKREGAKGLWQKVEAPALPSVAMINNLFAPKVDDLVLTAEGSKFKIVEVLSCYPGVYHIWTVVGVADSYWQDQSRTQFRVRREAGHWLVVNDEI